MTAKPLPPIEFLRECFSYDPDTGAFVWKTRPVEHFHDGRAAKIWNSHYAGTKAFNVGPDTGRRRQAVTTPSGRQHLLASRVAFKLMTGEEPPMVDHINRDPSDDRFVNLRASDNSKNQANRVGRKYRSLPKGVCPQNGRFVARARGADGKKVYLGIYGTAEEAHSAYVTYATERYGEHLYTGQGEPSIFD